MKMLFVVKRALQHSTNYKIGICNDNCVHHESWVHWIFKFDYNVVSPIRKCNTQKVNEIWLRWVLFHVCMVQNFIGFEWVYVNDSDDDTGWNENFITKGSYTRWKVLFAMGAALWKCLIVWKSVKMMHAQW